MNFLYMCDTTAYSLKHTMKVKAAHLDELG